MKGSYQKRWLATISGVPPISVQSLSLGLQYCLQYLQLLAEESPHFLKKSLYF